MGKTGNPQHGQIDSSPTFNIATVLLYNRAAEKSSDRLNTGDIRLSEAGSMATFVQVLQRKVEHRFGATGTPESLSGLAERVIGMKVQNVDPSSMANYGEIRQVENVEKGYEGTRLATGKGVNIVVGEKLSDAQKAKMEATAILLSIKDKGVNEGRGAAIVSAARESVHNWPWLKF